MYDDAELAGHERLVDFLDSTQPSSIASSGYSRVNLDKALASVSLVYMGDGWYKMPKHENGWCFVVSHPPEYRKRNYISYTVYYYWNVDAVSMRERYLATVEALFEKVKQFPLRNVP